MEGWTTEQRGIGVRFSNRGEAAVRVWAPEAEQVELCVEEQPFFLQPEPLGYWTMDPAPLRPGSRYTFRIDGAGNYPDPCSLSQPEGVHKASEAIDHSYNWTDASWKNHALEDYIIYELHTGTFTPEGNFAALIQKLDRLVDLGVTAIELMPVAQFPGSRNWGYDGVFPFAVQHSYGGAKGLQQLVDACHHKGLAVILDVVYNHLGPEGNYLGNFGPYTTGKYKTPWGGAINFDDSWCDGVRRYFIENALMWFRDFHIDALRLDAVHAIRDFGPEHILQSIRKAVDSWMETSGRTVYLIVESDLNDPRFINPLAENGFGMDAQWVDEFHHALRTATGEPRTGYYSDFNGVEHLAKAYADAYVYDGQFSAHRKKMFGAKTRNPGEQFVVFSQNHDQTGNRMLGERSCHLVSFEAQKLMAAAVILSPFLPLFFMGEEWGETNPFLYFVSHGDPQLAEAVRKGRKEEFAAFHMDGEAPDPVAEQSFEQSKLQWQLAGKEPHRTLLLFYKTLIALRKKQPALRHPDRKNLIAGAVPEKCILTLHRWSEEQHLLCLMNFSKKQQMVTPPSHVPVWKKIIDSAAPEWRGPQAAPETVTAGLPGSPVVVLQPESVLVYADRLEN